MPSATAESKEDCIGALLIRRALTSAGELERALSFQKQFGGRLGSILVRMGALSEEMLLPVLAEQVGMSLLSMSDLPSDPAVFVEAIVQSPYNIAWFTAHELLIWEHVDGYLACVARNPIQHELQEMISRAFPQRVIRWHFVRSQDIEALIKRLEGIIDTKGDSIELLRELAEEAPVIELVNTMIAQATDENASDVHVEPAEREFQVRFRIDGILQTRFTLPRDRFDAVVSRIKLISGLDIAERRLPQDGRISIRASGMEMDIRVSVIPASVGESIVMRLLPKERTSLNLENLGLEADHRAALMQWAHEPHGIVLVTGPTGSGKSTTLYALLDILNDRRRKIITVEDPVEYKMPGITQIQAHSEIGYDFARALRAILRHDPDVIMIGEIRDLETAQIAVQSALTGHMVLSTLHTNDAVSAFSRLLDMGLEPFLVASSIRAVEAQRLVRRLCHCATPQSEDMTLERMIQTLKEHFPQQFQGVARWRVPRGCPDCHGTGYRGRLGIYEFVPVTQSLQEAVLRRASAQELADLASQEGCRTLRDDGLIKAWQGHTSVEEVLRVVGLGEL
ncbi:MAG: Flp pilus assembly complex ATPase component TadA [Pseudomonadales bacterium]|nr:Flp pilus assembly complex ATPase component TadA [Pseudomonadales bacterium]